MAKKKDLSPLDLDLIQCEKDGFGCHYGKWKATQEQKLRIIPAGVQFCQHCGKPFVRRFNKAQKFCDAHCRDEAYKEKAQKYQKAYYQRCKEAK